ncbi:MAG: sensor domain-containing diguanylate cyclase [Candidatus Sedimenticola sp. (ex Thyasira tokunagai)]
MHKASTSSSDQDLAAENRLLQQQLKCQSEEASHNEAILKRFHERELTLLASEGLPELLNCLTEEMKHSFGLPVTSLVLHDPNHELRHLLLHTGITPEELTEVRFLDCLEDFEPTLSRLKGPWLGPFLGEDHAALFATGTELQSIAILPMIRRGTLTGIFGLGSRDPTRFTRHHASDFLHRLATIGAICLENSVNREHLVISGLTDALTGLHNRRYLERRLQEEVARARRYDQPLSCLFIDADHFKRINDNHGHAAGDTVLRELALRVKESLRASDVATRFGGEEFTLLLPQTSITEALLLAERIRGSIECKPIIINNEKELNITVSVGVSTLLTHTKGSGNELIDEADKALYRAKELGRNRVELYQTE